MFKVKNLFRKFVPEPPPDLKELLETQVDDNLKKEVSHRARIAAARVQQLQLEADVFDYAKTRRKQ